MIESVNDDATRDAEEFIDLWLSLDTAQKSDVLVQMIIRRKYFKWIVTVAALVTMILAVLTNQPSPLAFTAGFGLGALALWAWIRG